MILKSWEALPEQMKNKEVQFYYEILKKKRAALFFKRLADIILSSVMLVILSPVIAVLAVIIKLNSKGKVFFRQARVTQYGRIFRIFKFRTMVENAEKLGSQVTSANDMRVTSAGRFLRKYRLDELPQLINVFLGDMTFVGTRPEVLKYVECYSDKMQATLLLPAGITSYASIKYKNEDKLISNAENADEVYINQILPEKMVYNLESLERFSFFGDIKIMFMTVKEIFIT